MQLPAAAAEPHAAMQQQALPVLVHPAATESIADRLVQRLAQSGALGGLWGDPSSAQPQQQGQSTAQREAALEARLAALLEEQQQQRPMQPVLAANRRSVQQCNSGRAAGNAERRDSGVQTETALLDRHGLQVLSCRPDLQYRSVTLNFLDLVRCLGRCQLFGEQCMHAGGCGQAARGAGGAGGAAGAQPPGSCRAAGGRQ
jgi:hypothetical protein